MNAVNFTIEAHGRSRQLSEAGLAILLGLNPEDIRRRVTWYLGHGTSPWGGGAPTAQPRPAAESPGEGGKGGMGHVDGDVERNVQGNVSDHVDVREKKYSNVNDTDRTFLNVTLGEGEGVGEETPVENSSLAYRLAHALSDPSSLHCYERLVLQHPAERLERALELTHAVPLDRLKKSRAAYFMGVVRTLARTAAST